MKKVISLVLIFVFLVSLAVVQIGVNAQDTAPVDPANIQTLEEAQQALADAKSKLSKASIFQTLKILQQIKRLEARLMDLLVDGDGAKPTKCASLIDQSITKTDASIQAITKRICGAERIAYRGMCNPFLSNFSECEAKEHGHGGGHDGGGMMSGGNAAETMTKPCISAADAQIAIDDLKRAREALAKIQGLDGNADSVPDLCQKQN